MMHEYAEWCEKHPEATEEERQKVWDYWIRKLTAFNLVEYMLLAYR